MGIRYFGNSALAFASAMLLTAVMHEAGHGIAAQLIGFSPRIYAYYENNPTGTPAQNLIILAAGPLVSLAIGAIALWWYRRGPARYGFDRLLLFWIAWLGVMEFVNYLIVTPWLGAGDTAKIADVLGWSTGARYAVALVGVAMLVSLLRPAAESMFAAAPQNVPLDAQRDRRRYIMQGFYLPLIAGVVLTAPAGIGGNPFNIALGLLAAFGNIDVIAMALFRVKGARVPVRVTGAPLRIEPVAVLLWAILVVLYVTLLSRGLPI